jgi:hypothetical protein
MAGSTLAERFNLIDTLRAKAARLLEWATQESMKHEVREAIIDLDEAAAWLNQKPSSPSCVRFADLSIQIAEWRLQDVKRSLETYGPDVTRLG